MKSILVSFVTGVVTLAGAGPVDGAVPMTVRVRPILSTRTLPHAFYDQAVASLESLYPGVEFVDRERAGQNGPLLYSLLAWRANASAERVELGAVAVNGRRAWQLEIAAPSADYLLARRRLEQELQALADPPAPPVAELTLGGPGGAASLPADALSDLLWDLEVLLASCSVETPPGLAPAAGAFDLRIRYGQPRELVLGLPDRPALKVLEARVSAKTSRNEGWPVQWLRHAGGDLGLGKCDGGATLALLCRPELLVHAPRTVTESCQLSGR